MSKIRVATHLENDDQIVQTITFGDGEVGITRDVAYIKGEQFKQFMRKLGWLDPTTARKLVSVCKAIDKSTCRDLTEEELADGTCDVPFKLIDTLVNIIDGMEKK